MKHRIATPILQNLIKSADDEVTESFSKTFYDTDKMMIGASYNGIQDTLHDVEVYVGQIKISLTDKQLTIIYDHLKFIYDAEKTAVQEFKDAERYED
jgi:hypothetical protein